MYYTSDFAMSASKCCCWLQSAELFGSMVPSEMANMADFAIESLMQKLLFQNMIADVHIT